LFVLFPFFTCVFSLFFFAKGFPSIFRTQCFSDLVRGFLGVLVTFPVFFVVRFFIVSTSQFGVQMLCLLLPFRVFRGGSLIEGFSCFYGLSGDPGTVFFCKFFPVKGLQIGLEFAI